MSNPVYPENALPDDEPDREDDDIDAALVAADEQSEQSVTEPEDQDEADFDVSELL